MNTEDTLCAEIVKGNHSAFEQLFRTYNQELFRHAFKILQDEFEADEAVQHCFVTLWERRNAIGDVQSIKAYLYRSVYNISLNKIRHQKVVQKSEAELALDAIYEQSLAEENGDEKLNLLRKGIESLPDKNKEVVKLRFMSGLSTNEVSENLGITPRTVETHVSKALRFLRETLNPVIILYTFLQLF